MQDHFRTSVINKSSALEMQLVARGLEALGIQRKDRFLKNFTTTIGRRIYTPFEVGSPKGGWDLWHQIVICVHEHQHVVQQREGERLAAGGVAATQEELRRHAPVVAHELGAEGVQRQDAQGRRDRG